MNANEIVKKIKYNKPTEGFVYNHPDEEYMVDEIQKLLDAGIEVNVVDKPIVKHDGERVLLRTFSLSEGIQYPEDVKSAFIWCWYTVNFNEKELINIGFTYEKDN